MQKLLDVVQAEADRQTSVLLTINDKTMIDLKTTSADKITITFEIAGRLD